MVSESAPEIFLVQFFPTFFVRQANWHPSAFFASSEKSQSRIFQVNKLFISAFRQILATCLLSQSSNRNGRGPFFEGRKWDRCFDFKNIFDEKLGQNFSPKNLAFFAQTTASFCTNVIVNMGF
jgi:hypothetical protein